MPKKALQSCDIQRRIPFDLALCEWKVGGGLKPWQLVLHLWGAVASHATVLCRGLWTKVYPCFSRKGRIKKSCREEFDTAAFRVRLQKGRERERGGALCRRKLHKNISRFSGAVSSVGW